MKNKKYYLLIILLNVIAIVLIPVDLFLINVPSVYCVIISILIVVGDIYGCLMMRGLRKGKVIISLVCIFVVSIVNIAGFCYPYWNSTVYKSEDYESRGYNEVLTRKEAEKDLAVFWQHLMKVHPACYRDDTPQSVISSYKIAKKEITSKDEIKVYQFARLLEGIASQLNDAHTYVKAVYNNEHFSRFNYSHNMAGDKLVKVNGMPLDELLEKYSSKYSYESKDWGIMRLRRDLGNLEGLTYLGIGAKTGVTYTFAKENGELVEDIAYEKDFLTYEDQLAKGIAKEDSVEQSFCSYEIDENKSLALFTLTECNYNEEYKQCVEKMFQEVKDKKIENVAIDIRDNGGGSSLVINEIFQYLDVDSYKECGQTWRCGPILTHKGVYETKNKRKGNLIFSGDFYVLTSYGSFSSAMFFAEYVKDNKIGTIIGESPANATNGYGDVVHFKLPNSRFFMQVSSKKWERIDQETKDIYVEADQKCEADEAVKVLYDTVK